MTTINIFRTVKKTYKAKQVQGDDNSWPYRCLEGSDFIEALSCLIHLVYHKLKHFSHQAKSLRCLLFVENIRQNIKQFIFHSQNPMKTTPISQLVKGKILVPNLPLLHPYSTKLIILL